MATSDTGQVLPLVAVVLTGICAVMAIGLDVGHAQYTYRMLQATTDADALAAAAAMSSTTNMVSNINGGTQGNPVGSAGVVAAYSAITGGANMRAALPGVSVTSTLKCLTTLQGQGLPCVGNIPYNAIQVTQTMTLPTFFGKLIGKSNVTLTTTSTASARGGGPRPTNIAVILDTTLSMLVYDSNCGQTQMQCALNGFQVLLKSLQPCGQYQTQCSNGSQIQNSFDRIALFTFPAVTSQSVSFDSNCPASIQANSSYNVYNVPPYGYVTLWPANQTYPNGSVKGYPGVSVNTPWSFPSSTGTSYNPTGNEGTYQITPFLADYRVSDAATSLNSSSQLTMAAGAASGCNSIGPANWDGDVGTYYAGAIYAAQAALLNEQSQFPGSENVMIILGDGDAHSPQAGPSSPLGWNNFPSPATGNGLYPSWVNECQQQVTAAQAASSAGTRVYTVAYGASAITGCGTDLLSSPYLNNPCNAMGAMASAPQDFYSDWKQTGSDGTCVSSQPAVSLNGIFRSIVQDLSTSRLIPNNMP